MRPSPGRNCVSRLAVVAAVAEVAALAGLGGCGGSNPLNDVTVASASVTGVQWSSFDLILGESSASGVLNVVDTSGVTHTANVSLGGPAVGLIFDVSGADFAGTTLTLTLPPGKVIKGSDLFDTYSGSDEALHVIVGGEQHDLVNSAGVKLSSGNFDLGFGFFLGYEWINISLANGSELSSTGTTSGPTAATVAAATTAAATTAAATTSSSSGTAFGATSSSSSSSSSGSSGTATSSSSSGASSSSGSSGATDVLQVTLESPSFDTTGFNFNNCSTPAQPATPSSVSAVPVVCNPQPDGAGYSSTPVTVEQVVGCGNGNGALVQVTCSGTPANRDVTGTVSVTILDGSCEVYPDAGLLIPPGLDGGAVREPDGGAGQIFVFDAVAPSHAQVSEELTFCAAFADVCTPTNACAFNAFATAVTVSNVGP